MGARGITDVGTGARHRHASAAQRSVRTRTVLAWVALVTVLAGCARRAETVAHTRAASFCLGSLEACEAEGARFAPLVDSDNLTGLVREGGAGAGEAVTLAYRLPSAPAYCLEGSANRQRVRLRGGVVAVQDSSLSVARDDLAPTREGWVLVEVTMGAHKGLFGKEILGGAASAIARFLDVHLAGPLALAGWFTLAAAQQLLARRHRAQRVGSFALALLTAATAVRILSLQNGWSTLWLDTGPLRRTLELTMAPTMGIGAAVFYHWLVGAPLRAAGLVAWGAVAAASACFSTATTVVGALRHLRPLAVPIIMCMSVVGVAMTVRALVRGWHRVDDGERRLVLIGALAVGLGAVGDIVATRMELTFFLDIGLMPFGLVVETMCQALILARRNDRAHQALLRLEQVAREASEQALAEQERVNGEIKRLDRLKDEFLANTSHELRTPLHSILGLTESVLRSDPNLEPSSRERLGVVVASGQRLSALVNDLLDFSKLHHRAITIEPTVVELHAAVKLAIAVVAPLAEMSELELANEVPSGTLVRADEARLQQILTNLLGNAVKFTERGRVVVRSRVRGDRIDVSVQDTGIGIAPDVRERIFESFEQGDGSTVRPYGGTGLGLAVTKKLVELHGGHVAVRSEIGAGSTFTFDLPRAA
jgi:signal transduction histidine kinase